MALVLNGTNNTIGGLAVGGLPDGTIDAGTLADNAVTSPKQGSGAVLQMVCWNVAPNKLDISSGTWAKTTVPTQASMHEVETKTIARKSTTSKMYFQVSGHVDADYSSGEHPACIAILPGGSDTVLGAAYRHVANQGNEPLAWAFNGIDDFSSQADSANPEYELKCHLDGGDNMCFSRLEDTTINNNLFKVLFWEVEN